MKTLGATAELIARGLKVAVFRVRDFDEILLTIPFGGLATAFPFTLMCPQNQTEDVLVDRLRALGGEVVRPARLLSVGSTESGVEAQNRIEQRVKDDVGPATVVNSPYAALDPRLGRRTALTLPLLPPPQKN